MALPSRVGYASGPLGRQCGWSDHAGRGRSPPPGRTERTFEGTQG